MAQVSLDLPDGLKELIVSRKALVCVGSAFSREVLIDETEQPAFPNWHDALVLAAQFAAKERRVDMHLTVAAMLKGPQPDYDTVADVVWRSLSSHERNSFLKGLYGDAKYESIRASTLAPLQHIWDLDANLIISLAHDPALRWACPNKDEVESWDLEKGTEYGEAIRGEQHAPRIWPLNGHIGKRDNIVPPAGSPEKIYLSPQHKTKHMNGIRDFADMLRFRSCLFLGFSPDDFFLCREIEWVCQSLKGGGVPHYMLLTPPSLDKLSAELLVNDNLTYFCISKNDSLAEQIRALVDKTRRRTTVVYQPTGPSYQIQLGSGSPLLLNRLTNLHRIGSGNSCSLRSSSNYVSSHHADIELVDDTIQLTDRGSANGTRIGGARLSPNVSYEVTPGAEILISDVPLTITAVASAESQQVKPVGSRVAEAPKSTYTSEASSATDETSSEASSSETSSPPTEPSEHQGRSVRPPAAEHAASSSVPPPANGPADTQPLAVAKPVPPRSRRWPGILAGGVVLAVLVVFALSLLDSETLGDPPKPGEPFKPAAAKKPQPSTATVVPPDPCDFSKAPTTPAMPRADAIDQPATGRVCGSSVALANQSLTVDETRSSVDVKLITVSGDEPTVNQGPSDKVKTGRVDMKLIALSGGEYTMGSGKHRRRVALSRFQICETEVTIGQYIAVTGEKPSIRNWGGADRTYFLDHPVQQISWIRARLFMNELTAREEQLTGTDLIECYSKDKLTPVTRCTGFRLATNAEWEYAARALHAENFPFNVKDICKFGHTKDCPAPNEMFDWQRVKANEPNDFGLYGMFGNLAEWVYDAAASPNASTEPAVDPVINAKAQRIQRGGSYKSPTAEASAASVAAFTSSDDRREFGMRCARGPHFPKDFALHTSQ
ncbi:MAG: SUMF1/EgtB/PvdO family nonheme iron enzyme [Enhygromyxa sp.]